jgi:hypothetical protein
MENQYAVAVVIAHDKLRCKCGQEIDLAGADWLVFRKELDEALTGVQPLYAKVLDEPEAT